MKSELLNIIDKRIENKDFPMGYMPFDMSGYGLGDDHRTLSGNEVSRALNFVLFMDKFHDYMPSDFAIEDFKLRSWKGSIWWGEKFVPYKSENVIYQMSGWGTSSIIEWIILNFGKFKNGTQ